MNASILMLPLPWKLGNKQGCHLTFSSYVPLTHPPSLKLAKFHHSFTGNRRTYSHTIQASLGHVFIMQYFSHFISWLLSACPCDDTIFQTRAHILTECPLHERARHVLREVLPSLSLGFLLSMQKGLGAIVKFIQRSTVFWPYGIDNS